MYFIPSFQSLFSPSCPPYFSSLTIFTPPPHYLTHLLPHSLHLSFLLLNHSRMMLYRPPHQLTTHTPHLNCMSPPSSSSSFLPYFTSLPLLSHLTSPGMNSLLMSLHVRSSHPTSSPRPIPQPLLSNITLTSLDLFHHTPTHLLLLISQG